MKLHKPNCVAAITSAKINSQSGSSNSLKTQHLCLDRRIDAAERIAHLEQLVGRLTVALDIEKKASTWLN